MAKETEIEEVKASGLRTGRSTRRRRSTTASRRREMMDKRFFSPPVVLRYTPSTTMMLQSLGLLCTTFLHLYNHPDIDLIGLDDAVTGLEVSYLGHCECSGKHWASYKKKAKQQYTWIGFQGIPKSLEDLKAEGLRDGDEDESPNENYNPICSQQSNNTGSQPDSTTSKDNRREKLLGLLTQNFIKLLLCIDAN